MTNKWMISRYENISEKDGYVIRTGFKKDAVDMALTNESLNGFPISVKKYNTTIVAQVQHWFIDQAYTIAATSNNSDYGTVSIDGDWECAIEGEQVKVTESPKQGYQLDKLTYTVDDTEYDITSSKSFSMPAGDVEVKATFSQIPVVNPVIDPGGRFCGLHKEPKIHPGS